MIQEQRDASRVFDGLVVVDLTRHIAGPLCTQMLGDLGATVIKVESLRGDDSRQEEPFYKETSLYYMNYNRNKVSLALDFRSPDALPVLEDLVRKADVLVQNFRPGVMAQMGLEEKRIRELNKDIIYLSVSGFGPKGPYAKRAAMDEVLQAMSGLMGLTGPLAGPPTMVGAPIIDNLTGIYAFGAVTAALFYKVRTGKGQSVEVNLFGAALLATNPSVTRFLVDGVEEKHNGNRNRYVAGINSYETRDGYVHFVAYSNTHWQRLASRIGGDTLAQDDRYKTMELRWEQVDEIDRLIVSWTKQHATNEIVEMMEADGIPCGPVRSIGQVALDPELRAAERIVGLEHPNGEELPFLAMPVSFSATPPTQRLSPPLIGEHSRWVLGQFLGMPDDEVSGLIERGVVGCPT